MTNDEMITEHCGGCARFFERDPNGIQTITCSYDVNLKYTDTRHPLHIKRKEWFTPILQAEEEGRTVYEYRCNWLIPINKIYGCPCSQCLIKSVCWDQCEQATVFMQADPILFLDNERGKI
jgi:hypothetical protein